MHRRIALLSPECCCIRLSNKDQEWFRVFDGESFAISTSVDFNEHLEKNSSRAQWKKSGVQSIASWKSRWILIAFPHGQANVYELNSNNITLLSTFNCPVNTSAILILDDDISDCAIVIFGTDEGPAASRVHVMRLTFSSESLSVMQLKSWRCDGGVSSLAAYGRSVLVGFSSCDGVGVFDPFNFNTISSPSVRTKLFSTTTSSPRKERPEQEIVETVPRKIDTDGIPVKVAVSKEGNHVITLTNCGILKSYENNNFNQPIQRIQLQYDVIGMQALWGNDFAVCGCRGEIAIIDIKSGEISKFARSRETARVDDFAFCLAHQKLYLLQTDADDEGLLKVFDFGKAALVGSSKISTSLEVEEEEDEIVFVGVNDLMVNEFSPEVQTLMEKAWNAVMETEHPSRWKVRL